MHNSTNKSYGGFLEVSWGFSKEARGNPQETPMGVVWGFLMLQL